MKKNLLSLLMGCMLVLAYSAANATIKYVKADATGLNNGTSWTDAYTDLQSALTGAIGDTVWVANGVYKPTSTTNRNISFNITGRNLFGGFAGTETNLADRNYSTFQTILSGDIGVVGDSTDNSNSVVVSQGGCIINGFVIKSGYNWDAPSVNSGSAGIFLTPSSQVLPANFDRHIINCNIEDNCTRGSGGGLFSNGGSAVIISNCKFRNNKSGVGGAIACSRFNNDFQVRVINSTIVGNKAHFGGGISVGTTNFSTDRCVFSNNVADSSGGVFIINIHQPSLVLNVSNSLIVGNQALNGSVLSVAPQNLWGGDPMVNFNYSTVADNKALISGCLNFTGGGQLNGCIVWANGDNSQIGNQVTGAWVGPYNIVQNYTYGFVNPFTFNPQFVNSGNFLNAPFDASAFNYRLQPMSPAVDTSLAAIPVGNLSDLAGYSRGATGPWDLGCYDHCTTAQIAGDIMTNDSMICFGSSTTIKVSSGLNYIWNTGATADSITVDSSGLYIVTVSDTNGCDHSLSQHITVSTPVEIHGNKFFCVNGPSQLNINDDFGNYIWNTNDTGYSIHVSDTGFYYVSGTNSFGCFSSDTIHLSFPPLQAQVLITGDSIVCPGQQVTLTASGNLDYYFWNDPNFTINETLIANDSGIYYVKGLDSFGCSASDTFHLQYDIPTPVIAQNDATFETTMPFATYQWYKDNVEITGATQQQYIATESGSYTVKVTNANGCEGTSDPLSYTLTGIKNIGKNGDIIIYPNPANKYVLLDFEKLNDKLQSYTIIDIWGRTIQSESDIVSNNKILKIDLQNAASGTYYIKLETTKEQYSLKLVVVK